MIRAFAPYCALACALFTPIGAVADGFCIDNLNQLPLKASMIDPSATYIQHDPGYVQIMCLDCAGLRQMEVFLGVDGDDTETTLRSSAGAATAIADLCDRAGPECSANLITTPSGIGLRSSYVTTPFAQSKIAIYSAGKRLMLRVTAGADDLVWSQATVDKAFTALLPSISPPC